VAGLDLAELVNRKVVHQLAEANGRSEALVAEAISRELDRLVHELVETNIENRAKAELGDGVAQSQSASRACNRCGQIKSAGEYERGRGTCRACRREQKRESRRRRRQEPDADAEDHSPSSQG
jgi:hypothetical protein